MTTVQFEPEGFEELVDRLRGAETVSHQSVNEGLREIGDVLLPLLKSRTPVGKRPRRKGSPGQALRAGTRAQVLGHGADMRLEIRQGARTPQGVFYGRFVREGTRPHTIEPVRAPYLHFKIGDKWVRTKLVNHPGTKANPYHVRALRAGTGRIQGIVTKMGERITAFLAGR